MRLHPGLFFTLAALVVAVPAGATTVAGGPLPAGQTVWDLGRSPFLLTGDVTVPATATLVIEPGVVVTTAGTDSQAGGLDSSRVELLVDGTLRLGVDVNGVANAAKPVVLSGYLSTAGRWGGIVLNAGASGVVFKNADVAFATTCLTVKAPSILVEDSLFHGCTAAGINVAGAAAGLTMTSSVGPFPGPASTRVSQNGTGLLNSGTLSLTNVEVTANATGLSSSGNSQAGGCRIVSNTSTGVAWTGALAGGSQLLQRSVVAYNGNFGLSVSLSSAVTATVDHVTFDNDDATGTTAYELYASVSAGTLVVRDSIFTNNRTYGFYRSGAGGTLDVHHNLANGNATNYVGVTNASGAVACGPLYVATDGSNYRLTSNSPARSADSAGNDLGALPYTSNATPGLVGVLHQNTTLTAAGGPYTLSGDLVVPSGVTLSLEPGVVIRPAINLDAMQCNDAARAELIVQGTLNAPGTVAQRITLSPLGPVAKGVWGGLRIDAGSSGHTLTGLDVGFASAGLKVNASGVAVSDSRVHDSSGNGVTVGQGGSLTFGGSLATSALTANGGAGAWNEASTLTLAGTTVTGNGGVGLYSSGNLQASGNEVAQNGAASGGFGVQLVNALAGGAQTLRGNLVHHNASGGVALTINQAGLSHLVEHNTVDANGTSGTSYALYLASQAGTMTVRDNVLTNDRNYGAYRAYATGTVDLHHNLAWNNPSSNYYNVPGGAGAVSCNPLFVKTDGTNYRITANSPARGGDSAGNDVGALAYGSDPTPSLMGVLRTNLTLTKAASPWLLAGDLVVASGVALTIEPGATVQAATTDGMRCGADAARTELEIGGTLDAQGTATSRISFAPATGTTRGAWFGLSFDAGSAGSSLSYLDVGYAYDGLTTSATTLQVSDSKVHDSLDNGVTVNAGSLTWTGTPATSAVTNSGQAGVKSAGTVTVSGTTVSGNGGRGVDSTGNVQLTGNEITQNGVATGAWAVALADTFPGGAQLMTRNLVHHNGEGVYVALATGTTTVLDHNTLDNDDLSGGTGYELQLSAQGGAATVRDNVLTNGKNYGVYRSGSAGTVDVHHNLVWANASGNYTGITAGAGSLSANPLYVKADGTNYRLTENSPARAADSAGGDLGALPYLSDPTTGLMGVLRTNRTLTAAGSPWALPGDLTVAPGVTLTVEAGASLIPATTDAMAGGRNATRVELVVQGTVLMNGTPAAPILVRPATATPGQWDGLRFESTSLGNAVAWVDVGSAVNCVTVESPGLVLQNVRIHDCSQNGVQLAASPASLTMTGDKGTNGGNFQLASSITNVSTSGSGYAGITAYGDFTLANTDVGPSGGYGVFLNAKATVTDSLVHGCASYGVYAALTGPAVTLQRSLVYANATGLYASVGAAGATMRIDHDTFDQNTSYGLYLAQSTGTSGAFTLRNNLVTRSGSYGLYRTGSVGAPVPDYNDVWSTTGTAYLGLAAGTHSLATNPAYNYPTGRDYRLQPTSPARGADDAGSDLGALPYLNIPVSRVDLTPANGTVKASASQAYAAQAVEGWSGFPVAGLNYAWSLAAGGGTVSPGGAFVAGCALGTFAGTVTATAAGVTGNTGVTVVAGDAATVTVLPDPKSLNVSQRATFAATAMDGCGNVSSEGVNWTMANPQAGVIDQGGNFTAGTKSGSFANAVKATAKVTGAAGYATVTVNPTALASIRVSPANATIGGSSTGRFTATGLDQWANTLAVTPTWSVAAGCALGTIDPATGIFTAGTTPGTCTNGVVATQGGISGTATVTVGGSTLTSISLAPAAPSVAVNGSLQLVATGRDANNATVVVNPTWTLSGGGTLDATGLFTAGCTAGTFTATATQGVVSGSTGITVTAGALASIAITPAGPSVAVGTTKAFAATGADACGNAVAITPAWAVVAGGGTITTTGTFTPTSAPGTYASTIRAASGSVVATTGVTVVAGALASITLLPDPATVAVGQTVSLSASGKDAAGNAVTFSPVWSATAGGSIDASGTFTAGGVAGTFTNAVKATAGGVTGTASVVVTPGPLASLVVTPSNPSVAVNDTAQFAATGKDAGGNVVPATVTWSASAGGTIAAAGLFRAGTAPGAFPGAITATSGSISGATGVTVVPGPLATIVVTPAAATLAIGRTQQFTAVGRDSAGNTVSLTPTWSASGGGSIGATGLFTAGTTPGSYTGAVKATSGTISATASLTVTVGPLASLTLSPASASVAVGQKQQFVATAKDAAGNAVTATIAWTAAAGGSIDAAGLFTAGTTTGTFTGAVKATSGTVSAQASVTVTAGALVSIDVTPTTASVQAGRTLQLTATGRDATGNAVTIAPTWTATSGGTISATGVFTGGTVAGSYANAVKATSGTVSALASVTVTPGPLASLALAPLTPTLAIGAQQPFGATGQDGYGNALTVAATWSVVAGGGTITAAGVFTAGGKAGTFANTVKATSGTLSALTSVTVTPGPLAGIAMAPASPTVGVTLSQQFTATGQDAGGNAVALGAVTWALAGGGGTLSPTGLFTAGTVAGTFANAVKATSGSLVATATVVVAPGAPTSLAVNPNPASLLVQQPQQFTALARDSYGNAFVVPAAWTVVAQGGTINAGGLFTAGGLAGTFTDTVRATSGTLSATATVVVATGPLARLALTPNPANPGPGETVRLTATGTDVAGNAVPAPGVVWTATAGGTIDATGLFTAGTRAGTFTDAVFATSGSILGKATVVVHPGATVRLQVQPGAATLTIGDSVLFAAQGTDAYGNDAPVSPTWSVVAGGGFIDPSGTFFAGTVAGTYAKTVQATFGSLSAQADVVVLPGPIATVDVAPATASVPLSGSVTFTAVASDDAGNLVPFTPSWTVENGGGFIDSSGSFLAGTRAGTFADTVAATAPNGVMGTATVVVLPGPPTSLVVDPNPVQLPAHGALQAVARASDRFGNGVTVSARWSVTVPAAGAVNASGLFHAGAKAGAYPRALTVTASGLTAVADVEVLAGPLAEIVVSPGTATVRSAERQRFTALGRDADANVVAFSPVWYALNGVGTVSAAGELTAGDRPGSFPNSVQASSGSIQSRASVTVTPAAVVRVTVSPQNPTTAMGRKVIFVATPLGVRGQVVQGVAAHWTLKTGGGALDAATGVFTTGLVAGAFAGTIEVEAGGAHATTSVTVPADFDNDHMADELEVKYGLDDTDPSDAQADADRDGLTNVLEVRAGTNPRDTDSDDDGVTDGNEQRWNEDTDGDGLINALDPDSDGDGLFDGTEMAVSVPPSGTDLSAGHFVKDEDPSTSTNPLKADTDGDTLSDGFEDADHNGRVDKGETDPNVPEPACPDGTGCAQGLFCVSHVCIPPHGCTPACADGTSCSVAGVCETDEDASRTKSGCGCGVDGASAVALAGVLAALLRRRRR